MTQPPRTSTFHQKSIQKSKNLVRACCRRHLRSSPPRDTAPPLRLRTPQDGRRRAARRRELPAVAHDTRATLQTPRRDVRSTPDGGPAVQPPGLSYTAHWEVLGSALCFLTTTAISRTGSVWDRGFCPGSRRPRARVPLVVWALDFFLFCASLPWSPGPCLSIVFRSAICDLVSLNEFFPVRSGSLSLHEFSLQACVTSLAIRLRQRAQSRLRRTESNMLYLFPCFTFRFHCERLMPLRVFPRSLWGPSQEANALQL